MSPSPLRHDGGGGGMKMEVGMGIIELDSIFIWENGILSSPLCPPPKGE
jgi:hypothetical protein